MKRQSFFLFAVFCTALFLNSCKDDDTLPGYFHFVGDWHIIDSCSLPYNTEYDMKIHGDTTGQSNDIITLKSLYGLDSTAQGYYFIVTATVRGDSFFISPQQVQGYTITGSGVLINQAIINFEWAGGPGGSCTSTGTVF